MKNIIFKNMKNAPKKLQAKWGARADLIRDALRTLGPKARAEAVKKYAADRGCTEKISDAQISAIRKKLGETVGTQDLDDLDSQVLALEVFVRGLGGLERYMRVHAELVRRRYGAA